MLWNVRNIDNEVFIKMKITKLIVICVIMIFLTGCTSNVQYSKGESFYIEDQGNQLDNWQLCELKGLSICKQKNPRCIRAIPEDVICKEGRCLCK